MLSLSEQESRRGDVALLVCLALSPDTSGAQTAPWTEAVRVKQQPPPTTAAPDVQQQQAQWLLVLLQQVVSFLYLYNCCMIACYNLFIIIS